MFARKLAAADIGAGFRTSQGHSIEPRAKRCSSYRRTESVVSDNRVIRRRLAPTQGVSRELSGCGNYYV
jgi:hypothetical protein